MSLRKQGADQGAVSAFLISTPESGVDSIAVTYALMDPVMTVARPAAAFITATAAGLVENLTAEKKSTESIPSNLSCPVDNCCDGVDCDPQVHRRHHTFFRKLKAGLGFALTDLWEDMAGWFFLGLLLAGLITGFLPTDLMSRHLGGGLTAMLVMLFVGIPLYICATASTPIAAALVLKGVSPGAALVFLLAGPASNITSLTVLLASFGKRATAIYLSAIAVFSIACGLMLDWLYGHFGWSFHTLSDTPEEVLPEWLGIFGALLLGAFTVPLLIRTLRASLGKIGKHASADAPGASGGKRHASTASSEKPCACDAPT